MRPFLYLVLLTAPVAADPIHYDDPPPPPPIMTPPPFHEAGYVSLLGGLSYDHLFNAGMVLEVGARLGDTPLLVHASADLGNSGDFEGTGSFRRYRAGLDARTCSDDGMWCGFAGIQAGTQSQTWANTDDPTEHHHGVIYGWRAGIDGGSAHWRYRAGVDLYRYDRSSDVMGLADRTEGGFGVWMGLVRRF